MNINCKDKNIILEDVTDFDIEQTLECGQCFRFYKIGIKDYIIVAKRKALHISQLNNTITLHNTTIEEYEEIWKNYFDLDRDYKKIKDELLKKDNKLSEAIEVKHGVRILNQDFFETLISFIISQNKQIPHIKQIVETISNKYGEPIAQINEKTYYSFPEVEKLQKVTIEEFRECKVGFRDAYLIDACKMVYNNEIIVNDLEKATTIEAIKKLTTIKGVGDKIANCVVLFGLSKRDAFPIDVWIKRIMENLYFEKDTKKEEIMEFAKNQFGEYGGYAQQYLFYYGRENKIGTKTKKETIKI